MPEAALAASAKLYRPKLLTILAEGYGLADLRRDAMAGLTVAIVALPLSMAIAIASGVSPDRGVTTAIVGGFLVSALGGSRFQIGGPAGAFIVLVSATAAKFGIDGLVLAVLLSGAMMVLVGVLRLGSLIRHIPHAVTVGFTAGISVTILASQLKDLFGLKLTGAEPGPFLAKLSALARAWPTASPTAFALALAVIVITVGIRRVRPLWPSMLVAVALAAVAAVALHLPVETIGTRFGGIPHGLPAPHLPNFTAARVLAILPTALSFTLLGGIESLLSAVVADGMTGRRHRANMELIAQGIANMASALFGGISVTGTIARTATNVRAGARSPVAGMLHSVFLLAFILLAAPLASYVPVAALAGVLALVAWNMIERPAFAQLLRDGRTAAVLLATFGLTVARDLTTGIFAGCLLAAAFWGAEILRVRRRARPTSDCN
jgi:SulP family sulfate permease